MITGNKTVSVIITTVEKISPLFNLPSMRKYIDKTAKNTYKTLKNIVYFFNRSLFSFKETPHFLFLIWEKTKCFFFFSTNRLMTF